MTRAHRVDNSSADDADSLLFQTSATSRGNVMTCSYATRAGDGVWHLETVVHVR